MGRDPGLQPERTQLSWRRTGWSMLIPGLLCLRGWGQSGDVLYALSSLILLCASLAVFCGFGHGRHVLISLTVSACAIVLLVMILIQPW